MGHARDRDICEFSDMSSSAISTSLTAYRGNDGKSVDDHTSLDLYFPDVFVQQICIGNLIYRMSATISWSIILFSN